MVISDLAPVFDGGNTSLAREPADGAVAQLTGGSVAPAADAAILHHRAGVPRTGCNRN